LMGETFSIISNCSISASMFFQLENPHVHIFNYKSLKGRKREITQNAEDPPRQDETFAKPDNF
jgi:hypothetical protein